MRTQQRRRPQTVNLFTLSFVMLTVAHCRVISNWRNGMKTRWNPVLVAGRALVAALAVSSACLPGASFAAEPAAPSPVPGVWQKHQYTFAYLGFTSTYSCDGLADQLKGLLLAAGARADSKSRPGVCASPYGRPDKFARADLTFYTLAPLDNGKPSDEKPVDGVWRSVAFAPHSPQGLQIGDCELVDQFRAQVLPMFTARNIVNRVTCVPHQESGTLIDLRFDVFAGAPARGAAGRP